MLMVFSAGICVWILIFNLLREVRLRNFFGYNLKEKMKNLLESRLWTANIWPVIFDLFQIKVSGARCVRVCIWIWIWMWMLQATNECVARAEFVNSTQVCSVFSLLLINQTSSPHRNFSFLSNDGNIKTTFDTIGEANDDWLVWVVGPAFRLAMDSSLFAFTFQTAINFVCVLTLKIIPAFFKWKTAMYF